MNRSSWVVLALIAMCFAGGCATSAYSRLKDENSIPELAALKQQTLAHANHTALVQTHGRPGAPALRVAVHQIEAPGHDKVLVFLHGVFSDSSAWRFIAGDLAADHDLWLVDLPGCGVSDKPDPEKLGPDAYSPADLGARVLQVLRELLAARGGQTRFTLVGHSLGGTIAIRMFADEGLRTEYADVLRRMDTMVLSAPLDVALTRPDPMFEELGTISAAEIQIGTTLGVIRERVAAGILDAVNDPEHRALREEADQRVVFLNDGPTRRAMQAMLRQAVAWKGHRPDWEANEKVVAGYSFVRLPVLILWGSRDEVFPCSMGYKLAAELPDARMLCLENVMHSPHLETPVQTASLIREFASLSHGGAGVQTPQ